MKITGIHTVFLAFLCLPRSHGGTLSASRNEEEDTPKTYRVASFVANIYEHTGQQFPVNYDAVILNYGGNYDEVANQVRILVSGLYLVSLSAGTYGNVALNYIFAVDSAPRFSLYRDQAGLVGTDTVGRDMLVYLESNQLASMASGGNLFSTPTGIETSWGTAALSGSVGITTAFSVARTSPHGSGKIIFDTIIHNQGNGWNSEMNQFRAPATGTYFFSFSVGLHANGTTVTSFMLGTSKILGIERSAGRDFNNETLSRSVMLPLSVSQVVTISASSTGGFSDGNMLTSFSGFHYHTAHGMQYAWGLYSTTNINGGLAPVSFNQVLVNIGSMWANNRITCAVTGVYFVHISAGVQAHDDVVMTLMHNNNPYAEINRNDVSHPGTDTLSRSAQIECEVNDTLWILVPIGSTLYSNANAQTSFSGFYLHP